MRLGPVKKRARDGSLRTYEYDELVLHAVWTYWREAGAGPTVGDLTRMVPQATRQTLYNVVRRLAGRGELVYDEEYRKVVPVSIASKVKGLATRGYKEKYLDAGQ